MIKISEKTLLHRNDCGWRIIRLRQPGVWNWSATIKIYTSDDERYFFKIRKSHSALWKSIWYIDLFWLGRLSFSKGDLLC